MINISNFTKCHIEQAEKIALLNYNEERSFVSSLPPIDKIPDLERFAENNLGVAAFDGEKMLGYLCCHKPWDNAFKSTARGTFSPMHAHGTLKENRGFIYKKLYEAAAEKWVQAKIASHAIALYAHDNEAIDAMFSYGFGLRCIDAIRPMEIIQAEPCEGITFREQSISDLTELKHLHRMLHEHMGCSPCFMHYTQNESDDWHNRAQKHKSRIFIAASKNEPVAYIEITKTGETFVTHADDMLNICGAFCLPEYRGSGIYQNLLSHTISILKSEGYAKLGVDFESFNPTASSFWLKYFTPYTKSVVRRIDEYALMD